MGKEDLVSCSEDDSDLEESVSERSGSEDESDIEETVPKDVDEQAGMVTVTATDTTAGDGNTTSEIERAEQESLFHGATKASTAVIADAVSFGMTSAHPRLLET